MAPSIVPLFPSGTVVAPSQNTLARNTPARLSSIPNPVSASAGHESDVQVDESSLTPAWFDTDFTTRIDPQSG